MASIWLSLLMSCETFFLKPGFLLICRTRKAEIDSFSNFILEIFVAVGSCVDRRGSRDLRRDRFPFLICLP